MDPLVLTIPPEAVAVARLPRQGMEVNFSADWPPRFTRTASFPAGPLAAWPEWRKPNGTTTLASVISHIP
jgi:hypothetical protein